MIWHPILMAVLLGDFFSLLLSVIATTTAVRISTQWDPTSATRDQIRLERSAENAAFALRYVLAFFLISTLVLIIGITNVLPKIIPGAMCGTGVLQATDGACMRALVFRGFTLILLFVWLTLERLNGSRPEAPLTKFNSRVMLLVLPFLILSAMNTFGAIMRLDIQQPVDCCAVVYDQIRNLAKPQLTAAVSDTFWLSAFWILSALLLFFALWCWRSNIFHRCFITGLLVINMLLWVPLAAITLIKIFAAYYYQVLHHHCPWCLFLAEHKFVGVPLFGALTAVVLESLVSYLSAKIADKFPELMKAATTRSKSAGFRVMIAAAVFMGMLIFPAIFWRLRYGVWLG